MMSEQKTFLDESVKCPKCGSERKGDQFCCGSHIVVEVLLPELVQSDKCRIWELEKQLKEKEKEWRDRWDRQRQRHAEETKSLQSVVDEIRGLVGYD